MAVVVVSYSFVNVVNDEFLFFAHSCAFFIIFFSFLASIC
jgi:hypothetical protein